MSGIKNSVIGIIAFSILITANVGFADDWSLMPTQNEITLPVQSSSVYKITDQDGYTIQITGCEFPVIIAVGAHSDCIVDSNTTSVTLRLFDATQGYAHGTYVQKSTSNPVLVPTGQ